MTRRYWALKQSDLVIGDGCYDANTDTLEFATENELDMMNDDSPHIAIVDDDGEAQKWVMNSPRGKRRVWW